MEGILDFCMLENLRWRLCSVDILVDPFGRYNTCVEINLLPLVIGNILHIRVELNPIEISHSFLENLLRKVAQK